jgi:hypothetical protein
MSGTDVQRVFASLTTVTTFPLELAAI